MATKIQVRRDSSADWDTLNPTLSEGELGYETDTGKFKIGNGSTLWSSLEYFDVEIDLSEYATKTYADNSASVAVAALVDSAPGALNTLNELASALGDDENFASTVTTALGNKLDISSASTTYQQKNSSNLTITMPEIPTAMITSVSGSGTTITYTANNTFSPGDNVRISMNAGTVTTSINNNLNHSSVAIATASSTQFTITVASGFDSFPQTLNTGIATKIISSPLQIKNSSGNLVSEINQFGSLSNQAYSLVGKFNINDNQRNSSLQNLNYTYRLNNIFTGTDNDSYQIVAKFYSNNVNVPIGTGTAFFRMSKNGIDDSFSAYTYNLLYRSFDSSTTPIVTGSSQAQAQLTTSAQNSKYRGVVLTGNIFDTQSQALNRYTTFEWNLLGIPNNTPVSSLTTSTTTGFYMGGIPNDGIAITLPLNNTSTFTQNTNITGSIAVYKMVS